jgi:serine/threonine protein kinase
MSRSMAAVTVDLALLAMRLLRASLSALRESRALGVRSYQIVEDGLVSFADALALAGFGPGPLCGGELLARWAYGGAVSENLPRSFGPYTLLRRLAVGGMAEIYLAKALGLGGFEKLAALKLVHPHLSADPQFVRMLIDEAKILVLLTHANIAQVFDLGCIDGTYYISMEYVDGIDVHGLQSAAKRLGRELPIAVCCFLVIEMLNGLDYAHRKRDLSGNPLGIVHRDISPHNVVVSRAGEVKLVDFGIAKTNLRVEGTEVGVIKGKYGYMSPEQAWADPTDRRSDVFSAGVLLYELMTGSAVYAAASVAELLGKVRRAEILPPSRHRADISEQLSEIVMKALALEPSDRFQSANEMADALREFLYRGAQAFSGARLARYVVELLEADEKLAAESAKRADQTGGLHALRREDFLRSDASVIFAAADSTRATRNEAPPGRPRLLRESDRAVPTSRSVGEADTLPLPMPSSPSHPSGSGAALDMRPAVDDGSLSEPNSEDLTELWTARWFAQQGTSLQVAPDIRVREDFGRGPPQAAAMPSSVAPPSLSWPPLVATSTPPSQLDAWSAMAPALMPPRGDESSLGPLPRSPAVPEFRGRMAQGVSRRELGIALLFVLLAAIGALVAWESAPTAAIEVLSSPSGASVYIDGALQAGTTPLRVSGLRSGETYKLRLDLAGHRRHEALFLAKQGTTRRTVALVPD